MLEQTEDPTKKVSVEDLDKQKADLDKELAGAKLNFDQKGIDVIKGLLEKLETKRSEVQNLIEKSEVPVKVPENKIKQIEALGGNFTGDFSMEFPKTTELLKAIEENNKKTKELEATTAQQAHDIETGTSEQKFSPLIDNEIKTGADLFVSEKSV